MNNRTVVVTGAFGVLGRAVVQACLRAGHQVALIDYGERPKDLPASELTFSGIDLSDHAMAKKSIDSIAHNCGGVDVLFNIAGGFAWETIAEGSAATWSRLYGLNVATAVNCSRAAIPHLKRSASGRIVNVGAHSAVTASAGLGPYAASKSAIHRLTEALAQELKGTSITVNAVLPSIIDTPANRLEMPAADFSAWVKPADLAIVMMFLASEAACAITGALLPVAGRV